MLVLVPTRGRPASATELLLARTGTESRCDIMFVVDDDDPRLEEYQAAIPPRFLTVGPRARLGPTLNREVEKWWTTYDVIGFMGDDHRPRTHDWDGAITRAVEDGAHVVYGNDLFQGERLATAAFISTPLLRALGYFCPPGQVHLYLDDFWMMLGRATGMRYLPEVIIEHVHPVAGKAQWDAQYQEVNSPAQYDSDRTVFEAYRRDTWPGELERLRSLGF